MTAALRDKKDHSAIDREMAEAIMRAHPPGSPTDWRVYLPDAHAARAVYERALVAAGLPVLPVAR